MSGPTSSHNFRHFNQSSIELLETYETKHYLGFSPYFVFKGSPTKYKYFFILFPANNENEINC